MVSNLKRDERIVFFATDAYRSANGRFWNVPVHAWVHEPEKARTRKAVFATLLKNAYELEANRQTRPNFDRRVGLLCVDNESGKRIVIDIAGERFALSETASNGHAHTVLQLDDARVSQLAQGGVLSFQAVLPRRDARIFTGWVNLIDPEGLSVISDIDDTIKITEVRETAALLDRTFFRDFEAAPGMAALYARWAGQGASFHYVSSSPWHLYEPLDEFMDASGFPTRSMSLKLVRAKDRTLLNLFRKGTETKPDQIEPILQRHAHRRFVLVGDSGEQDPEVYAGIAKRYPDRILRIYIRNVDGSAPTDPRYQEAFDGIDPDLWCLFTDPADLSLPSAS